MKQRLGIRALQPTRGGGASDSEINEVRLKVRHTVLGGICALAIVGCCLPLVAAAASSGAERLRIRAIAPDEATQFIRGEHWTIYLDGTIDVGADERLARVIQEKNITAASVTLNSRGGDVSAGMGLGRVIRAAGFSTDVGQETAEPLASAPGVCFSACAFAYAGGGCRYLDEESKIGVHRVHREVARADDLAAGQSVSGVITRYFSDMGVSTELFALMAQIPSEDLHVLAPEEARRLRLVNDGRGVPEWSIEASDAGFYLRGAQDTASGPGKVVLGCVGTGWVLMGFYSVTNAEEIAAGAVRASIRVDDAFVSLPGKDFYAKNGDVVGMADLAPATVERLRRASEIGFAFHPSNPEIFWGFAVEVGEFRDRVERYFSACQAK